MSTRSNMKYCAVIKDDLNSKELFSSFKDKIKHEYNTENPDYVISIGGDGTILKTFHQYPNATIFAVHTGHLGFYTNYSINDIDDLIEDINSSNYSTENLDLLSCKIIDKNEKEIIDNALNEITIVTPLRTLILDVNIDNEFFEKFRGTGLCISTPSGSTAYNKSLHGSVVDCRLNLMQLTEIAGINSNSYRTLSSPLILASNRIITLNSIENVDVFITVDHISYDVKDFKSLTICYSDKKLKMAYHKHEGFIKRVNRTFLISKN